MTQKQTQGMAKEKVYQAQPNFVNLTQALGTVAQELSNLQNIPAVNVANQLQTIQTTLANLQTTVTALQTSVTNLQAGVTTLQTGQATFQATLQQNLTTLDMRNYARTLNSRIFSDMDAIVLLPDLQNQYPANFPANVQQIRALNVQAMDTLLNFYGLATNGTLNNKRKRLSEYLGIKLL
ncbi:hypothetical protein GLOIN_2v1485812 [Rhizophagus clarus]|uniref:Uncharacterized protein n=2 Tax=Rhizophagus clarus TaxID=94130 RepID=A0A8H3QZA6_9GLOM|nr:hypothetical protein GLOIN_2v1485812 [Rhizophagus clarus]